MAASVINRTSSHIYIKLRLEPMTGPVTRVSHWTSFIKTFCQVAGTLMYNILPTIHACCAELGRLAAAKLCSKFNAYQRTVPPITKLPYVAQNTEQKRSESVTTASSFDHLQDFSARWMASARELCLQGT